MMEITNILSYILPIINLLFAFAVIYLERKNVGTTWAWLMVILLLPFLGFIIYLILGQNLARQKIYKIKQGVEKSILQLVQNQADKIQQGTFEYSDALVMENESLIYMNLINDSSLLTQDNTVEIYINGEEKFKALLEQIAKAKKHIHLLYYKISDDTISKRIIKELVRKAKEGVEIRLIYDAIGSIGISTKIFNELKSEGGKVFAFFPSKVPYLNFRVNYRNHRKLAVIDGEIGFIGGFNIGDEYLGLNPETGFWRDTHLLITGSAVKQLQAQFFWDWSIASKENIKFNSDYFINPVIAGTTAIQIVSSGPHSEGEQVKDGFIKMIFNAKKSIYIQTPYFIPDESVLNALKIASLSGVDVRIMIPMKGDHRFVQWAAYAYLGELLRSGVKCYLYHKGFLHAKTLVVDGKIASVGTANFDNRSFKLNFEIDAFIYDAKIGARLANIFEMDLKDCNMFTLEDYKDQSVLVRLGESMSRLLSPIL